MNRESAAPVAGRTDNEEHEPAALTAEEFALFERVGRTRSVEAGEQLFRRGDLGTVMFVIAQGEVDLDFGDDLLAKRLGRHEFFGELGLLIGDHARSADAVCARDGTLVELRQEEFEQLVEHDPRLFAHFLRRANPARGPQRAGLIGPPAPRNLDLQTALDRCSPPRPAQPDRRTHRTDELTASPTAAVSICSCSSAVATTCSTGAACC